MSTGIPFWEESYSNPSASTMGGASHEVIAIADAAKRSERGLRVLDVGCGEGRNSLFLGSIGHSVLAVDISEAAIAKLRKMAQQWGYPIEGVVANVSDLCITTKYDVCLVHGLLHFLEREQALVLMRRLQAYTRAGGLHVITASPVRSGEVVSAEFSAAGYSWDVPSDEIRRLYEKWETLMAEEYTKWDWHPGFGEHSHRISKWVFQEPGRPNVRLSTRRIRLHEATAKQLNVFRRAELGGAFAAIEGALGSPDLETTFHTTGTQFAFGTISETGYSLRRATYGNCLYYVSKGSLIGKALYDSDLYAFEEAC